MPNPETSVSGGMPSAPLATDQDGLNSLLPANAGE